MIYLKSIKNNSSSYINQTISAIKFFYKEIYPNIDINLNLPRPKKDNNLPIVLSKNEVYQIINSLDNIKHKAILSLTYSSGLRVSEVVNVKVSDIDSKRGLLHFKAQISNLSSDQSIKNITWIVQNNAIGDDTHYNWYIGQKDKSLKYKNKTKYTGSHILL